MRSRQLVLAVALSALMIMSAGCAGWGTDGPANETPEEETDGNDEAQDGVDPSDDDTDDSEGNNSPNGDEEDGDDSVDNNSPGTDSTGSEEDTGDTSSTGESDGANTNTGTDTDDESDTTDDTSGSEDTADSESANDDNSEVPDGDSESTDEDGSSAGESDSGGSDDANNGDGDRENGDENTSDNGINASEEIYTLTVVTQSDVPVTLERVSDGATTERTATDGTVEFEVIEGYYGLSADGHTEIDPELSVEVTEDTTIEMQSTAGETISVTVIDAETGDPIEDATIEGVCNWYYSSGDVYMTGEAGSDGIIPATAGLTPTVCDATVDAAGYESRTESISVPDDDGITIELEPEEAVATAHAVTFNVETVDNVPDGIEIPPVELDIGDEGQLSGDWIYDGSTLSIAEGTYDFSGGIYPYPDEDTANDFYINETPGTVQLDSDQEVTYLIGYEENTITNTL